jgi:hypothetical protein
VAVVVGDDQVTVAWALPLGTVSPAVDLCCSQRTPTGIETVEADAAARRPLGAAGGGGAGVHSAVAAWAR